MTRRTIRKPKPEPDWFDRYEARAFWCWKSVEALAIALSCILPVAALVVALLIWSMPA